MIEAGRTGLFAVLHAASSLEARVESRLAEVGLSLPKLAALHHLSQAGTRCRLVNSPSGSRV